MSSSARPSATASSSEPDPAAQCAPPNRRDRKLLNLSARCPKPKQAERGGTFPAIGPKGLHRHESVGPPTIGVLRPRCQRWRERMCVCYLASIIGKVAGEGIGTQSCGMAVYLGCISCVGSSPSCDHPPCLRDVGRSTSGLSNPSISHRRSSRRNGMSTKAAGAPEKKNHSNLFSNLYI